MEIRAGETTAHSRYIRFVAFREGELWVAQCLEFDIGAQANSRQEIQRRIPAVLQCEVKEGKARYGAPFSGLDVAPPHFRTVWAKRLGSYTALHAVDVADVRVEVAFCAGRPAEGHSANLPTLAEYCAWATSAGCGVQNNVFTCKRGYADRVTKMTTSALRHAFELGILDGEILAPTTLARLDRRLGLRSVISDLEKIGVPLTGTQVPRGA